MVFSSSIFLFVFLPLLLALYFLPLKRGRQQWRNGVLLAFSIGFYAWGEPVFVFLMILSIFVNWFLCLRMSRSVNRKKRWLTAAVSFDVLLLVIFKYASFLSRNLALLTGNDRIIVSIALPIGISFFTFQLMSYVFDVYYGHSAVQKNPLYVALYISLFPQLIAGPIVRYQQVENEIIHRQGTWDNVALGMKRFMYGLGKKVLISNYVAQVADNVFNMTTGRSVAMAWIGALCYALQIYYDFSGYSDMAIGLGRMFGFHFEENFNYPYTSFSVTEFWRRWHISLGTWFRDYVYIPLGGNRAGSARHILNLLIVWTLTGVWHGANWTFLVWGLFYFSFLVMEKYTGLSKRRGFFNWLYAMTVVLIGWIIFRSESLREALAYLGNLIGIQTIGFADASVLDCLRSTWAVVLAACIGAFPIAEKAKRWAAGHHLEWLEMVWLLVIFLCSVLQVVSSTYNPFIYFNF